MVPLSMWGALAQLKFLGNVIVVLGDVDGQFLPIEDQDRHKLLKNLDRSAFMHDLVNGLHVTLRKYRRGADSAHYNFVGTLDPGLGVELPSALKKAKARYPASRGDFLGTTLCISNDTRVEVNKRVNDILSRSQAEVVFVPKPKAICHEANKPQNMYVWPRG